MKKLLLLCALALCIIMVLPACTSSPAPDPTETPQATPTADPTEATEIPATAQPAAEDTAEAVANTIRDFYDAYNEGQVMRCTSYLTDITEEEKSEVELALSLSLKLAGKSEIKDIEIKNLEEDSATADITLKIGGETKTKTWQMIKTGSDWKLVWEQAETEATAEPTPEPTATATPEPQISLDEAKSAFDEFMTHFQNKEWAEMWPMLHPDVQALYENEAEFAANMDLRSPLKQFIVGPVTEIEEFSLASNEYTIGTDKTYSDDVVKIQTEVTLSLPDEDATGTINFYSVLYNEEWKFFLGKLKPPAEPALGFSRDNPVPAGDKFVTPDGIEVTIHEVKRGNSAWIIIRKANAYADYPDDEMEYLIITLRVKNISSETEPWEFNEWHCGMVGSLGKVYRTTDKYVVMPDENDFDGDYMELEAELMHGGRDEGSLAFYIDKEDTDLLFMWESRGNDPVYLQTE